LENYSIESAATDEARSYLLTAADGKVLFEASRKNGEEATLAAVSLDPLPSSAVRALHEFERELEQLESLTMSDRDHYHNSSSTKTLSDNQNDRSI